MACAYGYGRCTKLVTAQVIQLGGSHMVNIECDHGWDTPPAGRAGILGRPGRMGNSDGLILDRSILRNLEGSKSGRALGTYCLCRRFADEEYFRAQIEFRTPLSI